MLVQNYFGHIISSQVWQIPKCIFIYLDKYKHGRHTLSIKNHFFKAALEIILLIGSKYKSSLILMDNLSILLCLKVWSAHIGHQLKCSVMSILLHLGTSRFIMLRTWRRSIRKYFSILSCCGHKEIVRLNWYFYSSQVPQTAYKRYFERAEYVDKLSFIDRKF